MIKRTTRFRRKPTTHIFVFMISSEVRNKKPYALSVQCIPCAGFKGSDLRQIVNNLLREMVAHKMKVAGTCKLSCLGNLLLEKYLLHPSSSLFSFSLFSLSLILYIHTIHVHVRIHTGFVSNGEFNYLRTKGYTRPLSVLKIRADVLNKYNRLRHSTLLSMLTPKCEKHIQCTPINAHLTMHACVQLI